MPTLDECTCCGEIDSTVRKMNESDRPLRCITEHEGFEPVCLNVWVLQTAYFQYRQEHGDDHEGDAAHEYRTCSNLLKVYKTLYYLGDTVRLHIVSLPDGAGSGLEEERVVLPSCAVTKVRHAFPSAN